MGAGLVALPALRFAGTMTAAAALNLCLAVAAALALRPRSRALAAAGLAGLAVLAVVQPPTPWRVLRSSPLAAANVSLGGEEAALDDLELAGATVYYAVGRTATVLVREQGPEWRLTTNGLPESVIQPPGSRPGRYLVSHWMTLLPVALRPDIRSLLVVGLGGGGTIEDVPPSIERIHVVELEPEVVAANRSLSASRRVDPLADPRLRLHLDDARSALQLAGHGFDAIVSQPSHPWTGGSAHLFTREFYELVKRRLNPGGVFVQWMGFAFVDEPLFRTLVATLRSAFPHVEVYQPPTTGAALLVASQQPFDLAATAPRGIQAAASTWSTLGVLLPEDIVAARVLDADGAARLAEGAPLNTDRRNLLQTRSPRILANPLTTAMADRAFAPVDAVRRLPDGLDTLYLVRRLAAQHSIQRALRLATSVPDEETRRAAFALVDMASGHADRGLQALHALLATRRAGPADLFAEVEAPPVQREAPFGLLLSMRLASVGPGAPPALSAWARRDVLAGALLEGWKAVAADRSADMQSLEPQLAAVDPRHPAFTAATRLRVAWRLATRDPARAREALSLQGPVIASTPVMSDMLARARLASIAGDPDLVRVTLYEILPALERRSELRANAEDALRILDSVAGGDAAARATLRQRLAAAARRT
jgi:spermidine synthase